MIRYKGYTGVVEYDDSLEFFAGHVVDLRDGIYFEGRSVGELKASMQRAVDAYLESCAEDGVEPARPYSGRFVVRIEAGLHRALATAAASENLSLNSYVEERLREMVQS